ncbi:hypothetical protein FHR34_002245 [Kitasatospora kifunensis]|uniref:Uncharacterized protein n=1 Tax=Kitasatospora kifunensis TaxID=58351 RepID=A0A7W7R0N4_KITKI|nr:hypothetical protein [Kitasatospora kifunensis]
MRSPRPGRCRTCSARPGRRRCSPRRWPSDSVAIRSVKWPPSPGCSPAPVATRSGCSRRRPTRRSWLARHQAAGHRVAGPTSSVGSVNSGRCWSSCGCCSWSPQRRWLASPPPPTRRRRAPTGWRSTGSTPVPSAGRWSSNCSACCAGSPARSGGRVRENPAVTRARVPGRPLIRRGVRPARRWGGRWAEWCGGCRWVRWPVGPIARRPTRPPGRRTRRKAERSAAMPTRARPVTVGAPTRALTTRLTMSSGW